jgi:hypothetical protein
MAAAGCLVVAMVVPVTRSAALAVPKDPSEGLRKQLAAGLQVAPKHEAPAKGDASKAPQKAGPAAANPFLGLVPDATKVDWYYWNQIARQKSDERAASRPASKSATASTSAPSGKKPPAGGGPIQYTEAEPAGAAGQNDTPATAEVVTGLGTGANRSNQSTVLGQHSSPGSGNAAHLPPFAEDDGSIPQAGDTQIPAVNQSVFITGAQIGDGPHGSSGDGTGDFDFVKVTAAAGEQIVADIDTPEGSLDSFLGLWDAAGTLIAVNDDSGGSLDSHLEFVVTADGDYSISVGAFGATVPADPFDSGSGPGARSEGPYDITVSVTAGTAIAPFAEDDGSIPLAGDTRVAAVRDTVRILGAQIGDGPHGSAGDATGDFDFLKVTVDAGKTLVADIDTPVGSLDSVVALWSDTGELLAVNDDSDGLDSRLEFNVNVTGTYYIQVAGFGSGTVFPADPFDSGSGFGVGSEGPYDLTVSVITIDRDFFAVDAAVGDVIAASVIGSADTLVLYDPSGNVLQGSKQDASFIYAPQAPLPGGGNAVLAVVAPTAGRYALEIGGAPGAYQVQFEDYRPGPEALKSKTTLTLFLDFDGARVNTAIWGGAGVRDLSPLSAFLAAWGLSPSDEQAVIDATVASVRENILTDLKEFGTDPTIAVNIRNSSHDADTFGQANVSRVIVGGTIAESGIDTIGISQYIDPGNFATGDSALVLLDVLSDPSGSASLNTYLTPASDKIGFIGRALGNVISHEIGHLLGNFHTDPLNGVPNLMDAGGAFPGLFGVGPDNIGGTADDVDYDFGHDVYYPAEGFVGVENTLDTSAWALAQGKTNGSGKTK